MRHPLHDYAGGGGYFVTYSTYQNHNLLGSINTASMHLSDLGQIVVQAWETIPARFPGVVTDSIQVMPNHVHCILFICSIDSDGIRVKEVADLRRIIHWFKGWSSRQINLTRGKTGVQVWQHGYHDRIIRNEGELDKFRGYVENNPIRKAIERSGR